MTRLDGYLNKLLKGQKNAREQEALLAYQGTYILKKRPTRFAVNELWINIPNVFGFGFSCLVFNWHRFCSCSTFCLNVNVLGYGNIFVLVSSNCGVGFTSTCLHCIPDATKTVKTCESWEFTVVRFISVCCFYLVGKHYYIINIVFLQVSHFSFFKREKFYTKSEYWSEYKQAICTPYKLWCSESPTKLVHIQMICSYTANWMTRQLQDHCSPCEPFLPHIPS